MNVGKLNKRVDILICNNTPSADGFGVDENFTIKETVWAKVDVVAGSNYHSNRNIDTSITHKVTIRFWNELTSEFWIRLQGKQDRKMRIRNIRNIKEENTYMLLECEEVSDNGNC